MRFRFLKLDHVNRATATLDGVAGKSVNVAKVLQILGEQPIAVGFAGGDRGRELVSLLAGRGIATDFVEVKPRTRQCVTVIDEARATQTELVEESQPVTTANYQAIEKLIRERLPECQGVIMSGTLTPGGPTDFYFRCTELANAAGALSAVDAQGPVLLAALNAKPGLVKPNRAELAASVGRELHEESSTIAAMRELAERGAQRVLVTAGAEPALAFDGHTVWRIRVPRIPVVNPIGSGDATLAALVFRLLRGDDLPEASRWAMATGAANALTPLAGEVEPHYIQDLLKKVEVEKLA